MRLNPYAVHAARVERSLATQRAAAIRAARLANRCRHWHEANGSVCEAELAKNSDLCAAHAADREGYGIDAQSVTLPL